MTIKNRVSQTLLIILTKNILVKFYSKQINFVQQGLILAVYIRIYFDLITTKD